MSIASSLIELQNVSFAYDGNQVLKDISFSVIKGDYVGVVGPNGGGKTTLIKLLLGILPVKIGSVRILGHPIHQFKDWYKIGYVAQRVTHVDLSFPITVEEIVSMGRFGRRGLFRWLNTEDKQKVDEALKRVGMEGYKQTLLRELSGGQQQRVFIARALASDPEILILDEPTVGVDQKSLEQFYSLLKELNQKGSLTLLLVTHDIDTIIREANKILCIEQDIDYYGLAKDFSREDEHMVEERRTRYYAPRHH